MRNLFTRNDDIILIDDTHYEYLKQFSWKLNTEGYVCRTIRVGQKFKYEILSRTICLLNGLKIEGLEVDHKDRNKLNNQQNNLVPKTKSGNLHNHGPKKNSTTGIRGVSWDAGTQTWRVRIQINGTRSSLGRFHTLEEAITVKDNAEEKLGVNHK